MVSALEWLGLPTKEHMSDTEKTAVMGRLYSARLRKAEKAAASAKSGVFQFEQFMSSRAFVGTLEMTTLMVTRYGINGVKEIEFAKRRLEQNGLLVKGVIFNAVERKASTYSEYGYYQYEYQSKCEYSE